MRVSSLLLLALPLSTGCVAGIMDKTVKNRTVPELSGSRDLGVACAFGEVGVGLSNTVSGQGSQQALTVAFALAGLCSELSARELSLQAELALKHAPLESRAAAATDARLAAERAHADAARRFQRSYELALAEYGDAEHCKLRSRNDEGVYLLGLMSGLLAQVNDGVAGGTVGVPLNQILEVGRATQCLDDAAWWSIPSAARNAGWATVPGSAPAGVDPWAGLEAAAQAGDAAGQGIPRSLWAFTAANAGDQALLRRIVAEWPAQAAPAETDDDTAAWALLDAYARVVGGFEADLIWIGEQGHRAPQPLTLPPEAGEAADPFGADDPFGAGGGDPFAAPSSEAPSEDGAQDASDAP
ncbi:MAG: hypothetical protein H6742_13545 [Alphaproteobacteria bacterium]|nr:hypothetical protein [Alphaproteobacteria bacterium]